MRDAPRRAGRLDQARVGRRSNGATAPSIVDLVPAAAWDEREAHDLQGVAFAGHEPLRPLVDHDPDPGRWTVPVRGHDPYEVAVGPIHAGVIESGHFRFHVVGDRILHLDIRLFYKHRGLERAAEGAHARAGDGVRRPGVRRVHRGERGRLRARLRGGARPPADGRAAPRPHDPARARADLEPPERHRRRLRGRRPGRGQHPLRRADGARPAPERGADRAPLPLRDGGGRGQRARSRSGRAASRPGGARQPCAKRPRAAGASSPSTPRSRIACPRSASSRPPMPVGSVPPGRPRAPPASARTSERPAPASPTTASQPSSRSAQRGTCRRGSSSARSSSGSRSRSSTPCSSARSGPPRPSVPTRSGQLGVGRVESPRGATSCVVERRGDRIERLRLRTGSYASWPAVAHAAADDLLPDFPLINKSFELCYACADR